MKHIATVALMLSLGVASIHAQQRPVKMTLSGSSAATCSLRNGVVMISFLAFRLRDALCQ